ncbi:TetR/AcrR family transcriptional regulator (plasmid) [Methylobacterium sp. NMS12]|uniref:TetR/AcrR family transcriptional regulator n=1 Tax=Methylobacterium sp. NMS12 TaxID=3079766 RepID=UPI003F8857E5
MREAILAAAYALLVEGGLGGFSIEAVAVRANVARTTIYRWWPSKGALAIESFLEAFRPQLVLDRTASTGADFSALLHSLARVLDGPAGQVAASVLAQVQSDTETRAIFVREFSDPLRRESTALVRAGVDRGEFRIDLDVSSLLDAAIGAMYLRLLLGRRLDPAWVTSLVETLLRACRPL